MSVRLFREGDRNQWDRYIMRSTDSKCYHLIGWKDVIERSFGHKAYYLLSEEERGEINGVMPLVHLKSILFGNFMVSLHYFNYGGICADNEEIHDQILDEAIHIARKENVAHIELRHIQHIDNGLAEKTAKVSMRLELPQKAEDLWKAFSSKLRNQIQRPEKEGMYSR